ncbi:hypothetical protein LJC37_05960, partial [Bacteroidales bacterium OttesenSCG-928-E04]|nr:hypothetical protein [Bacteroidales bacterium OttesenSCG-928-E04]
MGKIDIQQNILSLQSSELMLIAAGARKGVTDNSASGVHLRWLFNGYVGSKHLPKGDLDAYSNSVNFDRSRDFVRLYRADYNAIFAELDLSLAPRSVNGDKAQWVYNQAGKVFYVNFDKNRYDAIKNNYSWNPFTASTNFINAYGNYPIEIEVVGELFFGVKMHLALNGGNAQSSSLELETCSAPDNGFAEDKFISSRKTYSHSEYQYVHVRCENGKSVRFRTNNAALSAPIYFEFYSDSLMHYEKNDAWIRMGEYALSLDRNELIERLSVGNEVDGYWPRFVDGNVVHIPDYISRWFDGDHNICEILERYINISAAEGDNPTAEFPMDPNDPETTMSALDLLNFGAFDFHIARMLGLGTIDAYVPYYNQKYIYAVEYISEGLWENEYQIRRTQHIGMSIPVSLMDERLPLPVEIESVVPGIVNSADERGQMTDDEGYTHDGRSRYVTLIAKPCAEDFKNAPFFDKSNLYPTFNYSETTFPIFGGVRYAKGSA